MSRTRQSTADLRSLLRTHALTISEVERRTRMGRGSLQRILAGRRGRGLRLETVRRLSRGAKIPLGVLVEALGRTLADNEERVRRVRAVQEARLLALLAPVVR